MDEHLDAYRGQVILVTGGAGAIGSSLTRALAETGSEKVIVFDDLSSAQRWNVPSLPNVLFVEGSILDEILLKRVFFRKGRKSGMLAICFAMLPKASAKRAATPAKASCSRDKTAASQSKLRRRRAKICLARLSSSMKSALARPVASTLRVWIERPLTRHQIVPSSSTRQGA